MHRRRVHHRYYFWLIVVAVGIGFVVLNSYFRESVTMSKTTTPSDAVSHHIERKCTKAVEKLVGCKFFIDMYPVLHRQCACHMICTRRF